MRRPSTGLAAGVGGTSLARVDGFRSSSIEAAVGVGVAFPSPEEAAGVKRPSIGVAADVARRPIGVAVGVGSASTNDLVDAREEFNDSRSSVMHSNFGV